jgi:hypothetical protein
MGDIGHAQGGLGKVMQAIEEFWRRLGPPVFLLNEVPRGQRKPYIALSYSISTAAVKTEMSAYVYTYSSDCSELNELVEHASLIIPDEGALIILNDCNGVIKISRGEPFIEQVGNEDYLTKVREIHCFLRIYGV